MEGKNEKKTQKLSYEQLEAYAQQTLMKAQEVLKENKALRQAIDKLNYENNFREIECAIKCLEHADLFSPEFIRNITTRLEEVLTPSEPTEQEDKENQ